jgi:hypothetical protein
MNRLLALATLLLVWFAWTPSYAVKKGGPATVQCSCTCHGPGSNNDVTKNWSWSGTRDGCQGYAGGDCSFSKNGKTYTGSLQSCDVVVSHPLPGRQPVAPPVQPPPS